MFPFAKTFFSLKRADLLRLVALAAALAVVLVGLTVAGVTWLTAGLVNFETGWLDSLINWLVGALTGVAGWFMLPSLVILIGGIFQERVIHKVELAYYPHRVRTDAPRFWADLHHDLAFTFWAIFLNLMILPLYFIGVGFFASIALNSYLLGREFFEAAAGYHLGKPQARQLLRQHRKVVYFGGLVITLMTLIPLINLMMPILAIVWMVHLYHAFPQEENNAGVSA